MTLQTTGFHDGNPALRLRAGELLARYPDLQIDEERELLDFYNSAPAIDTALLTCDEALRPHIDAFLKAHARDLHHAVGIGRLALLVAVIGLSTVGAILLSL